MTAIQAAFASVRDFLAGIDYVLNTETIVIPQRKQMIVTEIAIDGTLRIDGTLALI